MVQLSDCSGSADIVYDFGEGFVSDSAFTYANPGLYSIRQIINSGGGGADTTYTDYIEVFAPDSPIFEIAICSGNEVVISNIDTYYDFLIFDMGDGSAPIEVNQGATAQHVFPNDAVREIAATGKFTGGGGSCGSSVQSVQPRFDIPVPLFSRIEMSSEEAFDLSFNISDPLPYTLEEQVNGGIFQTIDTLTSSQSSYSVEGRDGENNTYCYRLSYRSPCTGDLVSSETLCTNWLTALPQLGSVGLAWRGFTGEPADFESFKIQLFNGGSFDTTDPTVTSFTETDITSCGSFCYRLTVTYASGAVVVTPPQCASPSAANSPPTPLNMMVTAEGTDNVITWQLPPDLSATQLNLDITVAGSPTERMVASLQSPYRDVGGASGMLVCYAITFGDSCGLESESAAFMCPVVFDSANTQKTEDGNNQLLWRGFTNFPTSFVYELEIYDENQNLLEIIEVGGANQTSYLHDLSQIGDRPLYYRVATRSTVDPNLVSFSSFFFIPPSEPETIEAPEAFTPNNDALNETFRAYGPSLQQFEMKIFNRWGELIFISENIEVGWDGKYGGEIALAGYYVYIIEAVDFAGNEINKEGMFLLIR